MINFFASWCDPCREEMPLSTSLQVKQIRTAIPCLGIAVEDTRAAVMQYAKEAKSRLSHRFDLNSTVKRAYRIFGPPATFFIDGQGTIRDWSSDRSRRNAHVKGSRKRASLYKVRSANLDRKSCAVIDLNT